MVRESEIRAGERVVDARAAGDAGLAFIGRIRTRWTSRMETPRQGRPVAPPQPGGVQAGDGVAG